MALIPVYHVVPSYYPVDPDYDIAVSGEIVMGRLVNLDANGFVRLATGADTTTDALGIAGDSLANSTGYTPYSADLVISGTGATRSTSNRVSDFFNETAGSGQMTVYHSGGEFWTDQYANIGAAPGAPLYASTGGSFSDNASASGTVVARLIEGPSGYPSGVPGVDGDSVSQSISLGDFIRVKLQH